MGVAVFQNNKKFTGFGLLDSCLLLFSC